MAIVNNKDDEIDAASSDEENAPAIINIFGAPIGNALAEPFEDVDVESDLDGEAGEDSPASDDECVDFEIRQEAVAESTSLRFGREIPRRKTLLILLLWVVQLDNPLKCLQQHLHDLSILCCIFLLQLFRQ